MVGFDHEWPRVSDPADPDRCQSINSQGQCMLKKAEGSDYCPAHCNQTALKKQRKKKRHMYDVQRFKERLGKFEDRDDIKTLHAEIAVLRMVLEETLQRCESNHDLILKSQQISELAMKIEKLVVSCSRLDEKMGSMLDKTQALNLMAEVVDIVAEHVTDPEVVDNIANQILENLDAKTKVKI